MGLSPEGVTEGQDSGTKGESSHDLQRCTAFFAGFFAVARRGRSRRAIPRHEAAASLAATQLPR